MDISSAGSAGAASMASQGAVTPVSGAASTQADSPPAVGSSSGGEAGPSGDAGSHASNGMQYCRSMSTQDFVVLSNQAVGQASETPEIDLKKLLELMMALKLLEALPTYTFICLYW